MPFIGLEFSYENERGATPATLRRQSYGAILSGACGQIFGNSPVWHFNSRKVIESNNGDWTGNLNSIGAAQQLHVRTLFSAFDWWELVPRQDSALVTSGLSSAADRLYPALAKDGSFAMVYVPSAQEVSINMSSFSPPRMRARLYDPNSGTYTILPGGPFVNRGVVRILTDREGVIVLDADVKAG
jgi:hypothetical protein